MAKIISAQKLAANRANALRSTGPRTPEGKAASAQNLRKHRCAPNDIPVPVFEGFDDLADLRADLIAVYRPINSQELLAIERIAAAQLSLLRAVRFESGLFTSCLHHASDTEPTHLLNPGFGDPELLVTRGQKQNFALAEGFLVLTATSQAWKFFLRYQTQTERLYRRAIEEFDRLKALRPEFAKIQNEPILDPQPQDPEPHPPKPKPNPSRPASPASEAGQSSPTPSPQSLTPRAKRAKRANPRERSELTGTCRPGRRAPNRTGGDRRRGFPSWPGGRLWLCRNHAADGGRTVA